MVFTNPDWFWNNILGVWKGGPVGWDSMIFFREIFPLLLVILCLYHSSKTFGWLKTILFFTGSFLFTGIEENVWILIGHFSGQETYYFNATQYYLWFFTVPISVCYGWFFIAYSMVYISTKLFKNKGIYTRALVGGLLAMNLDLMIDPIAVRNLWWAWPQLQINTFWILGIPFTNFLGWFLLIFLFAILWDKVPTKEEKWGRKKTTGIFYLGLAGLLGLTLLILLMAQILATVIGANGINLGDPLFPVLT